MRRMGLVGMVVCLLASAFVALGTSSAQASFEYLCRAKTVDEVRACDDSGYADNMHKSWWRAYSGHNCTNYAGYRMSIAGVPTPPGPMGNGEKWAASARKLGYRVDTTPEVGSIGTWENVKGINHVVYVEQVGPGWIIYSDDTYSNREFRRIKVTVGEKWYPKLFIHFQDALEGKPVYPYAIPETLTSTASTPDSLTLSWSPVAGAPHYRVQYSTDPTMKGAKYASVDGSQSQLTLAGLDSKTTYHFRVAVVEQGDGAKLSDYTATPYPSAATTRPLGTNGFPYEIPADLSFSSVAKDSAVVSWQAVEDAPHYRVQYSTDATMKGAKYASVAAPATRLTLPKLTAGTTYHVRVAVVEPGDGGKLSDYTQTPYATVTTAAATTPKPTPTPTTPPANGYALHIPSGLRAASVGHDSLTVAWNAISGAPHYRVQYSTDPTMKGAKYADVAAPTTSLVLKGLNAGTRYHFRVAAVEKNNGGKVSDYTQTPYVTAVTAASAPAPEPAPTPPPANGYALHIPAGLAASKVGPDAFTASWKAVPGAAHYRVQYSTDPTMKGARYADVAAPATSLVLKGLTAGTRYHFRVAAVEKNNGAKASDYTQNPYATVITAARAHPGGYAYAIPAALTTSSATSSSLKVSWSAVSGAPHYRVQYSTDPSMKGAKYANTTGTSLTLSGLAAKTRHYIRVAVVEKNNGGKLSDYTQLPYVTGTTK